MEYWFIQITDLENGIVVFENVLPCLWSSGVVRRSQKSDKSGGVDSTKPSISR